MLELSKRSFLRLAGLSIVLRILPVGLLDKILAADRIGTAHDRKVIIVTFGCGVRYAETFAREGLHNIPRLHKLQSSGHFSRTCINQGVLFHFNSTASIITGNWQRVDDFGFQPPAAPTLFEYYRKGTRAGPMDAWVIATNKSFATIGASANRDCRLPVGANVVLPKQLLLDAVKRIVQKRTDNGVADRHNVQRQMESILNKGNEGVS